MAQKEFHMLQKTSAPRSSHIERPGSAKSSREPRKLNVRNLHGFGLAHNNGRVRRVTQRAILTGCALASYLAMAPAPIACGQSSNSSPNSKLVVRTKPRTLSAEDGLAILAAALDSSAHLHSTNDCSHLAHAIYEHAGFPYAYASSSDLYNGVNAFERIQQPQPGDLIAWRGHVGIVVKPSRHIFFSFLRSGPGIDDWASPYWKTRGRPHFYRYVEHSGLHRAKLLPATGSGLPR